MTHPRSSNERGRSLVRCWVSVKTMRVLLGMYLIGMLGRSNGRRRKSRPPRMGIANHRTTVGTKIVSGLIFVGGRSAGWKVATPGHRWGIAIMTAGVVWVKDVSRNRRGPSMQRLEAATMVLTPVVWMPSGKAIVVVVASGVFRRSNFLDRVGPTGASTRRGLCFRKGC